MKKVVSKKMSTEPLTTLPLEGSELEAQVQRALDFNADITAANPAKVTSHLAVTRSTTAFNAVLEDLKFLPDFNIRVRNQRWFERVNYLANSILENGFLADKPIAGFLAQEGKKTVIYVTDGHRRIEATHLANTKGATISELPVVLKDHGTNIEDLTVALVKANESEPLSPLELAIACKRLIGFRWSVEKIAQKLNFSEVYVKNLLAIAAAPFAIREMVESGEVASAVAVDAMRLHGTEAATVMKQALNTAKAAGKTKLTARYMPEKQMKKAKVKLAQNMFVAIERVKADPAYDQLSDEVKDLFAQILATVAKAIPNPAEATTGTENEDAQ